MHRRLVQIAAVSAFVFSAIGTLAGGALLTLTTAEGEVKTLSMSDLEAMPVTEFATSTIWTEGVSEFTGVALVDFVEAMSLSGKTINAVAINDYSIDIPISDAVEGGPMIAYRMDGKEMSARDKGPLWVIYPFDERSEYQIETYYSRSIWQLDRINVLN